MAQWTKLWSTNPLERLHREILRRCDVVGVFPDDQAVIRLVGTVPPDENDEWAVGDRRDLAGREANRVGHGAHRAGDEA